MTLGVNDGCDQRGTFKNGSCLFFFFRSHLAYEEMEFLKVHFK
jgi:hypothetical protein